MDAAGKAGIETPHRSHDIDALEILRAILFEDRRVLNGVFIRSGRAVAVARAAVPRRWRIGMVVGYLAVTDHDVMRQNAAYGLVEPAADRVIGHFEIRPRFRIALAHALEGLVEE